MVQTLRGDRVQGRKYGGAEGACTPGARKKGEGGRQMKTSFHIKMNIYMK